MGNFDWNTIGTKVSMLYEEMEYHAEYTIQRFEADLEIEKTKKISFPRHDPKREEDDSTRWISRFREVLESRRSILTKLFSFTNNLNSVDTLVEYCDYYKSHYGDRGNRATSINRLPDSPEELFHLAFIMMTKNDTTDSVLQKVWQMLSDDVGLERSERSKPRFLPAVAESLAMVIMADADLNAAVQALIDSQHTCFQVSKILVQEPIREEFSRMLENRGCNGKEVSSLFVFRNTSEALGSLNGKDRSKAISVWSEDIIAAKKFSSSSKTDTIWINAHGVLGPGLHSVMYAAVDDATYPQWDHGEGIEQTQTPQTSKTWDLFYGGKWQSPVDGKYCVNRAGVSIAQATRKDFTNCVNAARGAFKLWSPYKLSTRIKIVRSFAARLRANGDSELADTVLRSIDLIWEFGASLSIERDGEAEISTTHEPLGVVVISSNDQKMLFIQLSIACVTGNAVILVLNNESSVSFAPYCDLLSTCGFPHGVINSLFATDPSFLEIDRRIADKILFHNAMQQDAKMLEMKSFFLRVTKPKSVWLQCA